MLIRPQPDVCGVNAATSLPSCPELTPAGGRGCSELTPVGGVAVLRTHALWRRRTCSELHPQVAEQGVLRTHARRRRRTNSELTPLGGRIRGRSTCEVLGCECPYSNHGCPARSPMGSRGRSGSCANGLWDSFLHGSGVTYGKRVTVDRLLPFDRCLIQ